MLFTSLQRRGSTIQTGSDSRAGLFAALCRSVCVGYYDFTRQRHGTSAQFPSTMAQVVDFFPTTAFDPETVKLLCDAYDRVQKSLHDAGQPDIVNEVIAKRIIALAKQGERNPDKLCESVLKAFGTKEQRLSR
jgi:hypothetical protein